MFHNLMKHSILANHSPRKNYEESQILLAIVMTSPIATVCDGEIAASVDPKIAVRRIAGNECCRRYRCTTAAMRAISTCVQYRNISSNGRYQPYLVFWLSNL